MSLSVFRFGNSARCFPFGHRFDELLKKIAPDLFLPVLTARTPFRPFVARFDPSKKTRRLPSPLSRHTNLKHPLPSPPDEAKKKIRGLPSPPIDPKIRAGGLGSPPRWNFASIGRLGSLARFFSTSNSGLGRYLQKDFESLSGLRRLPTSFCASVGWLGSPLTHIVACSRA
jgi:hypothetical protein